LIRFITFLSSINGHAFNPLGSGEVTWMNNIPGVWEEKNYYYPIPEEHRVLNPNLGQNPGW